MGIVNKQAEFHEFLITRLEELLLANGLGKSESVLIIATLETEIREAYGCDRHYIPAPSKANRNREIVQLARQTDPRLTRPEIAQRLGVSEATVNRVLRGRAKPLRRGLGSADWEL